MKHRSKQPAKKLRAIQTSQHMHVVHRKHTGHVTPHRTTSYPVLAMLLIVVGVFLVGWTHLVASDSLVTRSGSYNVMVSVPGPPPTLPATIDSPTDGTVFKDVPITVSGSCPVNTYESLYRNGAFSGVALCDLAGHYEITTSLFPGANELQVRDFSQTDVAGPWSNKVTVQYNPPHPVNPPSTGETPAGGTSGTDNSTTNQGGPVVNGEPLIFKTSFTYEGHYVGDTSTWELDIEGGSAPYAVSVEWGDGTHTLISRSKAGTFSVDHVYKKAGGYRGSYVTKFSASDGEGTQTFLQLLAIVNNPPSAAVASGSAGHNTSGPSLSVGTDTVRTYVLALMKFIWPTYGFAVLLLFSFWLGERREYERLKPRLKKARHA